METHRCPLCQTWRPSPGQCQQIACSACGAVQCHSNGLGRGCCKVCYWGRLPGWSFSHHPSTCQYKGCTEPAVYAYLPGSKHDCCLTHGRQVIERLNTKRTERRNRYA